jgi:hypothetical protein
METGFLTYNPDEHLQNIVMKISNHNELILELLFVMKMGSDPEPSSSGLEYLFA